MIVELVCGTRVQLSSHAVARARERLWPALADEDAGRRLGQLVVAHGRLEGRRPGWMAIPEEGVEHADAYVWLTEEIVCPAAARPDGSLRLLSVLVRGSLSESGRERRRRRRAERAEAALRRARREAHQAAARRRERPVGASSLAP